MAEEIYGFDESKSKVTLKSGAGITVGEDGTIGHTNEMEASASYVGGTTAVPMIKIDENGHVVALTKQTIYPPTSAGEAGQVWTSDGAGAGKWAEPAGGGKKLYTGAITDLITRASGSGTVTVLKDFDIMYVWGIHGVAVAHVYAGTYSVASYSYAYFGLMAPLVPGGNGRSISPDATSSTTFTSSCIKVASDGTITVNLGVMDATSFNNVGTISQSTSEICDMTKSSYRLYV